MSSFMGRVLAWGQRSLCATVVGLGALTTGCSSPGGWGEPLGTASERLVSVSGTVKNQIGNPVPDVDIQLLDSLGDKTASAVSGADGTYTLTPSGADIPDGTYDIVVTPPSSTVYVPQTFPNQALSGGSTFDIVLLSVATQTVRGRVLNSTGVPVSGQSVCVNATTSICATTAPDGSFSLGAADGSYTLSFRGNPTPANGGFSTFNLNRSIVVAGDTDLGDLTLPTRSLSGLVRDSGGTPVPGAQVQANPFFNVSDGTYTGSWYGNTTTGADGRFSFPAFPSSGTLSASKAGLPSGGMGLTIVGNTDITLSLPAAVTVSGRIINTGGAPVSGQSVCLNGTSASTCVTTIANGTFTMNAANGSYSLNLRGNPTPANGGFETFNLNMVNPVVVAGSTSLGDITLPTRSFTGVVRDSGGAIVPGALVQANPFFNVSNGTFTGSWYGNTSTGLDGRFSFTAFPSSGTLTVSKAGLPSGGTNVTISGDTDLTVTLPAPIAVTGRVVDSAGAPVSSQTVCLNGSTSTCTTSAVNGTFALSVASGSYTTQLRGNPTPTGGGFETFNLNAVTPISVTSDVDLGDVALPKRRVSGRVLDPDGIPIRSAGIQANPFFNVSTGGYSGIWYGNTATGVDGRFEFVGFPSTGTMTVTPPQASGLTPFALSAQITNDYFVGVSAQFLTETASAIIAGDEKLTTDDEGDDQATPSDPVETTVILASFVAPQLVTIEEVPVTAIPPLGYFFLTQQINITAPGSSDPNDPLEINFRIDCSRFFPALCNTATANGVVLFRNGQPPLGIPACNAPGVADPPTCIDDRAILDSSGNRVADDPTGQGDVAIRVLTLAASYWTFAFKLDDDIDGDRVPDADDACPDDPEDIDGRQDTDGCPELEDADGDGIEDFDDACPSQPEDLDGNDDSDGCPEVEDADGDGIDDAVDACPADAEDLDGNSDTDGCPEVEDLDGDGIPDAADVCPAEAEDLDGNADTDGCPEVEDTDGDGILDPADACPAQAEDMDGNADLDGCPEVEDHDGDGIPDSSDHCPYDAEDLDGHADEDGCPDTEPPPVPCADFDGDGTVTRRDIAQIRARVDNGHGSRGRHRYDARFDLNADAKIDDRDLALANAQLGQHCH